jgi:mRNA interferase MazF
VTNEVKGYPFEVALPEGFPVSGAVLSDHVKSRDWRSRNVELIGPLPPSVLTKVLDKLRTLFD